ncbi:MAG: hypothetical protein HC929_19550 [Leptolyngbyaceae cyanobacterium SM2_5_2]|nr:hypothetical protein [Leptolyngbyaceae cyanobacterium SM2_5_2]
MISAVVPPQPLPQPQPPAPAPVSVQEMAAAGYFRAIALWLNEPLVTQGIFVQVQADSRPGCLKLTLEFERSPIQDRLVRFLCHRIWQLNSELIEGVHILARPVGLQRILWQQRVKIVTPALKRRKADEQITQATRAGSPLPPQIHAKQPRALQDATQRLKTLRAFVLTGSAVAAFLLGCVLEVMTSGTQPSLPSFTAQTNSNRPSNAHPQPSLTPDQALAPTTSPTTPENLVGAPGSRSAPAASASPKPPANRPTVVDTALEPVGVISHQKPTPVPADKVTLLFGGDISLDSLDYSKLEEEGGFFAEVEDYFQADVSMVNLANPLATAATTLNEGLHQKTRPDAVELLVESGIDIVNLTNSNLMQYGAEGLSETLTALDSKGLYRVGAGRNAMEARRPEILDVKGKRIAYLSYAMGGDNAAMDTTALKERAGADDKAVAKELENFKRSTAFKDRAGFNAQNMPEIVADLQAIRNEVDWIVVNFRWVEHLDEKPNFVQTNLARLAIDQGADVVVGYHPTVVQGGEIYKGRPIAYSLGDFVFKADQPVEDQDSAMLKVSLQDDKMKVEFVPVRVRDSRPKTLTGQEGEAVLQRIQQASAQFENPIPAAVELDLKAPPLPPAEAPAPDSPFVTPEADQTLPLAPDAKATPDDAPKPDTEQLTQPSQPEPAEAVPPGSLPAVDLEEQIDNLPEWGPKVSPQQQQFEPIPQNRSGAASGNLDAQAPNLLRQLTAPLHNPAKASPVTPPAEADPWADSVPVLPTPEAAPSQTLPPERQENATPTLSAEPAPDGDETAISAPAPEANSGPEENTTPTLPAIPAQAEPMVGPLGLVDNSAQEPVALGTHSEPAQPTSETDIP